MVTQTNYSLAERNVTVVDHEEMRNAMINAYLQVDSRGMFNEVDSLKEMLKDYKFIADTIIGKGAIPCSHYSNTGLYKNTCNWCKAVQLYEALAAQTA